MILADLVRHASLGYATHDSADDFFNGLLLFFVSPFCWACSGGSLALDDLYDSGEEGSMSMTKEVH